MSADDVVNKLERFRNARTFPFYEDGVLREAAAEIVRLRGEVCSCPSGDGSLRWPCKAHPPEAIAPAAQVQPSYTTGHCKNRQQPGGCHLHNLHCGFPECDRHKVDATNPAGDALGVARETFEVPRHYVENLLSAACLLELSGNGVDKREAAVLRNIAGLALQHRGDSRGGEW